MRITTRLATLSLVVIASAPLRAQTVSPVFSDTSIVTADTIAPAAPATSSLAAPERAAAPTAAVGAPMTGLRSGVHARETSGALQVTAAPARANLGQSRALMIVGVAALITGAIIGGDPGTLIMVGGAVVGLYGLYNYLQ